MKPFDLLRPSSIAKAISAKQSQVQFLAGGTNLVDLMKKHIATPDVVLDVTPILSSQITGSAESLLIGAAAKNSSAAMDKLVLASYPLIAKAILAGASPQIRNMASTAGNLLQRTRCPYFYDTTLPCNKRNPGEGCGMREGESRMGAIIGHSEHCVAVHPSDLCIALAALDAEVLYAVAGEKKPMVIPFKDFHRLPGDAPEKDNNLPQNALITGVRIPKNPFSKNYAYVKLRDRDSYAFALVSVAAALHLQGGRIVEARLASGGVAHKPWRWYQAENFLKGKIPSVEVFAEAAALAANETAPLVGNAFKKPMLKGAIEVALQNCLTA